MVKSCRVEMRVRVAATLEDSLLRQLDSLAGRFGEPRSELVREIFDYLIMQGPGPDELLASIAEEHPKWGTRKGYLILSIPPYQMEYLDALATLAGTTRSQALRALLILALERGIPQRLPSQIVREKMS